MLLGRVGELLGRKHLESADYAETSVAGLDDIIDIAVRSSLVRIAEEVVVFFLLGFLEFGSLLGTCAGLEFLGIEDGDCTV